MNKKLIIAILVAALIITPASAKTIEVCNTCGNTTFNDAMTFAINGDIINVSGDLLLENMNLINKAVTVEGNGHTVNISLSTSSERAIELHGTPAVFNNITLVLTKNWNTAILLNSTDFGGRTWNNVRIEVAETTPSTLGNIGFPTDVTGIAIWGSSDLTLNNYTSHDVLIPLWVRDSNYGTQRDAVNITVSGNALIDRVVGGLPAQGTFGAFLDQNIEFVNLNNFDITGYTIGLATMGYSGVGCGDGTIGCSPQNITYKGNLKSNTYGMRMWVYNLSVVDSVFDNSIDATVLGDTNYQITNSSFKTLVSLPNATNFNVSNWVINKVTVEGTEYDVAGGYDVVATIPSAAPYNLTLSYNKSRVTELNLDTASLRVLHINVPNETLTPIATDTARGTLTVRTSSFSPFIIFGTRLSSTSGGSSSGSGGYCNQEWYNPDCTRKTTPTPTATPTTTPTATPEQTPEVPTAAETAVNPPMSTPTSTSENTPAAQAPGFEAVFAIAGLLAVSYLSRKAK